MKKDARPASPDVLEEHENVNAEMSLGELGTLLGKSYCDGCGFSADQHAPDCPATRPPALEEPEPGEAPPLESAVPPSPASGDTFFPSDPPREDEVRLHARRLAGALLRRAARGLNDVAQRLSPERED